VRVSWFQINPPPVVVDRDRFYRSGVKRIFMKHEIRNTKFETKSNSKNPNDPNHWRDVTQSGNKRESAEPAKNVWFFNFGHSILFRICCFGFRIFGSTVS